MNIINFMSDEMFLCVNGHLINGSMKHCPTCGVSLGDWFCVNGHPNSPTFVFCQQCGCARPQAVLGAAGSQKTSSDTTNFLATFAQDKSGPPSAEELRSYPLADGGSRFTAQLIDLAIIMTLSLATFWIASIPALLYAVWMGYIKGIGGQSIGYLAMKQFLVTEDRREPIGGGAGIGREFLHILDALPFGAGYIVGLITGKTFADQIMHTVVVKKPQSN